MSDRFRDLSELDRVIHEPSRLIILALLFPLDTADFVFLLRETGLTRGNLSAHLARLEEAGYLTVEKGFQGRVPRTTYSLTEEGRSAFRAYRERMRRTVESLPE
jgi:DNA-binding MarR family transcriptional regulator